MCRVWAMIWVLLAAGMAHAREVPDGMAEAQVIFLGEVHDNAHAHARQAELVDRLQPKALVFEMLTP